MMCVCVCVCVGGWVGEMAVMTLQVCESNGTIILLLKEKSIFTIGNANINLYCAGRYVTQVYKQCCVYILLYICM